MPQRDEYDQTQLASTASRKYSHSGHRRDNPMTDTDVPTVGDIYGAESQWSTKLSRTSFQPSFAANRMADESKRARDRTRGDQAIETAPEIITAGPEPASVTVMVSADYQKHVDNAGNMNTMVDAFGMKTNMQDHTEKSSAVTTVTTSSLPRGRFRGEKEASSETQNWTRKEDSSNDSAKKIADPLTGRKVKYFTQRYTTVSRSLSLQTENISLHLVSSIPVNQI